MQKEGLVFCITILFIFPNQSMRIILCLSIEDSHLAITRAPYLTPSSRQQLIGHMKIIHTYGSHGSHDK